MNDQAHSSAYLVESWERYTRNFLRLSIIITSIFLSMLLAHTNLASENKFDPLVSLLVYMGKMEQANVLSINELYCSGII